MLKYLRIAVTALSLTACVLLSVLWVRSYYSWDQVRGPVSNTTGLALGSNFGQLSGWGLWFDPATALPGHNFRWQFMSFAPERVRAPAWEFTERSVTVPHWLPVLLFGALAVAPWVRWNISRRTLLIATALVAVGLGIIMYLAG